MLNSRTSSVAAIANTPSLKACMRAVPTSTTGIVADAADGSGRQRRCELAADQPHGRFSPTRKPVTFASSAGARNVAGERLDAVLLARVRERAPVAPRHALLALDHEREAHASEPRRFRDGPVGDETRHDESPPHEAARGARRASRPSRRAGAAGCAGRPKPVRDVLDGVWFGNPLQPAL